MHSEELLPDHNPQFAPRPAAAAAHFATRAKKTPLDWSPREEETVLPLTVLSPGIRTPTAATQSQRDAANGGAAVGAPAVAVGHVVRPVQGGDPCAVPSRMPGDNALAHCDWMCTVKGGGDQRATATATGTVCEASLTTCYPARTARSLQVFMSNRDERSFEAVYQVMLSLSDEQVDKLLQTLQPQTRRGV